jgi:DNA-binding SARP family transcriptional activator
MLSDTMGVGGRTHPRLQVRLLGVVEVILDGRRLRAFNSLRLHRFLALIALQKGSQHRSRLAFELWPDSDEQQARTNLRKLLHEFRHALPDIDEFVEVDNTTIRWIPTGPSEVDVLRFTDAIAARDFELAARLYAGDFLPACYDDWILGERSRLRSEALQALVRLTEESAGRGDHKSTIKHAQRINELEPTEEIAVQFLLETYHALGDRTSALRLYHRYAETLSRELSVKPDVTIEELYRNLRTGLLVDNVQHVTDPAPVTDSPFVGRIHELTHLKKLWRNAQEGRAHLVLVTGEAGIGKSRIALEIGRYARAQGHIVASTRAYEAAGKLPWGPIVDLLRSDVFRSHIKTLDPVWQSEIGRLLPEITDTGQIPGPSRSGEVAQRHRLFDAVRRAIVVPNQPRLLIIDDLQWCDAETTELIGFIIRAEETAPVLIVGTVRLEEVAEHHPLTALISALEHDQTVTEIPLDRFDKDTTVMLAARMGAEDVIDPGLGARLWSETEGNPLFVVETLRAGFFQEGSQAVITPTMRAVLSARLGQLTEGARRLVDMAAVVGRPFSIALMASATRTDESMLVDQIDELWRRRIFREQGIRYDFSHDKLRAFALEMVNPARRRQHHRAVAAALEAENRNGIEAVSAQLAAHYDRAGMVEPAIEAYRVAGARAAAASALDEAVTHFQRALSLLAEVSNSPDRDALELDIRIALGSPLVALEGYGSNSAHQLYERARALCRKLQRPVDPPILRGLGLARLQGCRFEDCGELGKALLENEDRDPVAQTEGRYLLGVSAFWQGDLVNARTYLEGAIKAYDVSHRDEHLTHYAQDPKPVCLVRLALVELWTGDVGKAEEMVGSAMELANDADNLMTLGYVITYSAILECEAENFARLADFLAQADKLWQNLSERYLLVVLEALRGWREVCEGSKEGIEKVVEAVARSRVEGESLHLNFTLLLLARARGLQDEVRQGRAAAREGLEWSNKYNQRYLEAELWRIDGELAFRSGEIDDATTSLYKAVEIANSQGAKWPALRALYSLASRFPDRKLRTQLKALAQTIPKGHDLPAFRAVAELLKESE